jgi:CheY-like chemotaxis protein
MGSARPLTGHSILVLEDEPLVALDVVENLQNAGAKVVVAHTLADALKLVKLTEFSAAVLDFRLGSDDCAEICFMLRERGISFAFYTGYAAIPPPWSNIAVVKKPASPQELIGSVAALLPKSAH